MNSRKGVSVRTENLSYFIFMLAMVLGFFFLVVITEDTNPRPNTESGGNLVPTEEFTRARELCSDADMVLGYGHDAHVVYAVCKMKGSEIVIRSHGTDQQIRTVMVIPNARTPF